MKKKLIPAIQLAIGIGLFAYLFSSIQDKGKLLEAIRTAATHWPTVILALCLFGTCLFLVSLRWKLLLSAQGLNLTFRRSLKLYFIGHFFNSFLLGATGGDIVKAYYAAKETHHKKTEAVATIAMDRIMGLFALVSLVVVIMLARLNFFLSHPETRLALAFFFGLLIAGICGTLLVFYQDLFERFAILRRLKEKSAFGSIMARVYSAFQIVVKHPKVLWLTLLLSLSNHLLVIASGCALGYALEIQLPFWDYMTTLPIINAVAAIPLTPGGFGTREATAIFMLGTMGVEDSLALMLSILIWGTTFSWSLVGGGVYLIESIRGGIKPQDAITDAADDKE
ncbi:MAG: flippase-like domain-containing protein [Kiritimatiellae bacterium]|nr:flippase-like domain-containing protein [Kiritimatiellia bacterium]